MHCIKFFVFRYFMKNLGTIILYCLTAVISAHTWAQTPEPSDKLTKLSEFGSSTLYSFNYPTVNNAGESIVLSSALIAWTPADRQEGDSIESIHIYGHATIGSDEERPTSTGFSKEQSMLQILPKREFSDYATGKTANYVGRCVIIAPDYEGFGVSKNLPHPYLAERLTARQMIDAYYYGIELYSKQAADKSADNPLLSIKSDWRLFTFGYSQGAAATLALQRHIEENNLSEKLHYYGSLCGDGPYDLIETMRYYFYDDGTSYDVQTEHRKGISTYPVVLPLIFNGMCATNPEVAQYTVGDFLSQQLLDTGVLDWVASKKYTTSDMSAMWYEQLQEGLYTQGRHYTPEQMAEMFTSPIVYKVAGKMEKMLTQATFAYLNDPDKMATVPAVATNAQEALHRALADNSVATGWEPKHRIQFYHTRSDMVVPYGNYIAFRDAHKSGENTLYRINDTFAPDSDHMDAAVVFFVTLCGGAGNFADDYNWICEGSIPTGIDITQTDTQPQTDNNWYTLDGRRLTDKPAIPGIYIHAGKKIVIK